MDSVITGRAYVLGDNIDTDQIIPAQYLSFNPALPEERKFFGMYAMSSVPEGQRGLPQGNVPFVRENEFKSDFSIVIGGKNFGSGSSREHAPLALAEAGVRRRGAHENPPRRGSRRQPGRRGRSHRVVALVPRVRPPQAAAHLRPVQGLVHAGKPIGAQRKLRDTIESPELSS